MIWFAWRQFRTQTWTAICAVTLIGIALAIVGRDLAAAYTSSGLAGCSSNCDAMLGSFLDTLERGAGAFAYNLGGGLVYIVPPLIGAFWGAPLVARELESGTFRLAWSQSVTRTRWLLTKVLGVGAVSVATAGLLSLAVTWSASSVDLAMNDRITPTVFGARGIVPMGYAAFGFALGVTLGLILRRTLPAMAATLLGTVGMMVAMPVWLRAHLAPVSHSTAPLDTSKIKGFILGGKGNELRVVGNDQVPGAWVLSNDTITASGTSFVGPPDPRFCNPDSSPKACMDWIQSLDLRQTVTYHPADHFWTLQWVETGLFVGLAGLLGAFCVWWVRRRLV